MRNKDEIVYYREKGHYYWIHFIILFILFILLSQLLESEISSHIFNQINKYNFLKNYIVVYILIIGCYLLVNRLITKNIINKVKEKKKNIPQLILNNDGIAFFDEENYARKYYFKWKNIKSIQIYKKDIGNDETKYKPHIIIIDNKLKKFDLTLYKIEDVNFDELKKNILNYYDQFNSINDNVNEEMSEINKIDILAADVIEFSEINFKDNFVDFNYLEGENLLISDRNKKKNKNWVSILILVGVVIIILGIVYIPKIVSFLFPVFIFLIIFSIIYRSRKVKKIKNTYDNAIQENPVLLKINKQYIARKYYNYPMNKDGHYIQYMLWNDVKKFRIILDQEKVTTYSQGNEYPIYALEILDNKNQKHLIRLPNWNQEYLSKASLNIILQKFKSNY